MPSEIQQHLAITRTEVAQLRGLRAKDTEVGAATIHPNGEGRTLNFSNFETSFLPDYFSS